MWNGDVTLHPSSSSLLSSSFLNYGHPAVNLLSGLYFAHWFAIPMLSHTKISHMWVFYSVPLTWVCLCNATCFNYSWCIIMFWYLVGQVFYFILLQKKNTQPFLHIFFFCQMDLRKELSNSVKYPIDILVVTPLSYRGVWGPQNVSFSKGLHCYTQLWEKARESTIN